MVTLLTATGELCNGKDARTSGNIQRRHSYSLQCSICCNDEYFKRYCGSADINGRFADVPDSAIDDLSQVFTNLASWIYKNLQTEYEYLTSEECLIENAKANGYAFDEFGRIV